jgi:hypothetical protein
MNFLAFGGNFISCWIRIRIRNTDLDPDPGDKSNADPCGSGSETLAANETRKYLQIIPFILLAESAAFP